MRRPDFAVGHGTTRVVILAWRWAFKLPTYVEWRLFLLGLLANYQEQRLSRFGDTRLCPVLWCIPYGWLSVMPRCRVLTDTEFENFERDQKALPRTHMRGEQRAYMQARSEGIHAPEVERKAASYGWLGNRVVAIDYGN